ncbi:MAG: hypothetical protein ACFCA4_15930 [Cyanophyceae cyanobacterium]
MTTDPQDFSQWIQEIQALKQQVADLKRDRDAAYQASDKWQRHYTQETQQHRKNVEALQQTIAQLRAQTAADPAGDPAGDLGEVELAIAPSAPDAELDNLQSAIEQNQRLKIQLQQAIAALEKERQDHEATRLNLTTALGDAIEVLGHRES